MEGKLDLENVKRIFFIGIGGIGMSALARYFNDNNKEVFGYDKVETPLTRKLAEEGMKVHYDDDPIWIPGNVDLVIYTPAIPDDHLELNWFRQNHFPLFKRSEILGKLSETMKTIAVAGTHGKTSTSALIAHLLTTAGINPNAFLGGILMNYNSNYLGSRSSWMIAEADEYDRSFLKLHPDILVITSMDADHLDIYVTKEEMISTYNELIKRLSPGGKLLISYTLEKNISEDAKEYMSDQGIEMLRFGTEGDFRYSNVGISNSRFHFDYDSNSNQIKSLVSIMPGHKNIQNALVAISISELLGIKEEGIREGLSSFKGIKRRFEWVYDKNKVLIDDYAHHPEELKHAIDTVLELYSGRKITVIFQPHLYTRTRDFYQGFARELSKVNQVLLMPIYPAREEPLEGIESQIIFDLIDVPNKFLVNENDLIEKIRTTEIDVLMTLGAADLDKYHNKIIDALENK